MKKVINITIGGLVWSVEEDAYEKLASYLDAIKKYFSKDKDGDEIVEDLEASIAEKFGKRKVKEAAITEKDVDAIIEQIGTLKDFKKMSEEEEEEGEEESEKSSEAKKLYRDPDDMIIAGVCSGIAAYFGVETVLVRLIFAISVFFGGFGVLAYILLWIVTPLAETTAQKLEMRGERLTLHEIEKSVKRSVQDLKKKDLSGVKRGAEKAKVALNKIFIALGKVLKVAAKLVQKVLGLALIVAGIAGISALSFGLTWQLTGGVFPETDLSFRDLLNVTDAIYALFLASLYLAALMPMLLFFFGGLSLIKNRNLMNMNFVIAVLFIFFAASGVAGSIITQNAPLIEQRLEELDEMYDEKYEDYKEPEATFLPATPGTLSGQIEVIR